MGGLFDLIFIALVLWWIFRALGGRRGRGGEGGLEEPPEGRVPGRQAPRGQAPGERGSRARFPPERGGTGGGPAEEPEWRRRLKEAVRDWELEQRRQAGEPVPGPYGPGGERPATSARTEAPPRPLEQDGPEQVPRQPEPARGGPPPFPRPRPAPAPPPRPPSPHRRPPEARPAPRRPSIGDGGRRTEPSIAGQALDLGPQIGERGEAGDLATAGQAPGPRRHGPSGHRPLELAALRGLSDLQRAIVYRDILGPPRSALPPAHDPWF